MKRRWEKIESLADAALAIFAWALLFFVAPHGIESDGIYRQRALKLLMEHGKLDNGKWALIGTYLSAPLYWIGQHDHEHSPEWWVAHYNVILLGVGALSLERILAKHLPTRIRRAFVLLLLTSAMLPHETTEAGAETFNAIGLAVGLAAWGTRRWILGTILCALGVANMPASIVGLGFALFYDFVRERKLRVVVPLALPIALVLVENVLRKGGMFHTGYDHEQGYKTFLPYSGLPDFSYPMILGVLGLIFSFGKGILFFTPGLFLPWARERRALSVEARRVFVMWALVVVGLFAVYSRWWSWYGGYAWGPRFLVFASVPASFVLANRLRAPKTSTPLVDGLTAIALGASMWAGATGITFRMLGQPFCQGQNYAFESYCWYIPEFSVLATPFVQRGNTNADMRSLLGFVAAVGVYLGFPLVLRLGNHAFRGTAQIADAMNPRAWRI
jgi:hypothetical protein